jgi:hypothetical protein
VAPCVEWSVVRVWLLGGAGTRALALSTNRF